MSLRRQAAFMLAIRQLTFLIFSFFRIIMSSVLPGNVLKIFNNVIFNVVLIICKIIGKKYSERMAHKTSSHYKYVLLLLLLLLRDYCRQLFKYSIIFLSKEYYKTSVVTHIYIFIRIIFCWDSSFWIPPPAYNPSQLYIFS